MALADETHDETESLYEMLLRDISTGEIAGGQRLKVSELARRYGVSTTPVREVLRQMQGEGYVEISHNRGATVRKGDAVTIQSIFEILHLLEPYFVAWFAGFARPEMVDEMEAIQEEIEKNGTGDIHRFRELDSAFHTAICKRHYNRLAVESWLRYRRALNIYGARLIITQARYANIMREHRELLAAFRDNDVDRAVDAIRRHVGGSGEQMQQQTRMLGY